MRSNSTTPSAVPTESPSKALSRQRAKKHSLIDPSATVNKEHQMVDALYLANALNISWHGLHKFVLAGTLPAPVVFGRRCHRWKLSDVEAVINGTWKPEVVAQDGGAI